MAEAIGTFCLVFLGTGSIVISHIAPQQLNATGVSLVFGLAVLAVVYSIGHISGAHINPAVTIGFFAAGRLSKDEVPRYITAQLAGAVLASFLVKILFGQETTSLGGTIPSEGFWQESVILEFILTAVLMFVIMGVATDHRAQGTMAGVAIGGFIMLAALFAGPISGASMNPARSFGPALISWNFSFHWIYWLAPLLGSFCGARVYLFVQCPHHGKGDGSGCC